MDIELTVGQEITTINGVTGIIKAIDIETIEIDAQGCGLKTGDRVTYVIPRCTIKEPNKTKQSNEIKE